MASAPVESKVKAATIGAYLASAGLLGILTAIRDHHDLVDALPGALGPLVLALVPTAVAGVSGWAARHAPRISDLAPPPEGRDPAGGR